MTETIEWYSTDKLPDDDHLVRESHQPASRSCRILVWLERELFPDEHGLQELRLGTVTVFDERFEGWRVMWQADGCLGIRIIAWAYMPRGPLPEVVAQWASRPPIKGYRNGH